ncbi:MAG: hypothetical protein CL840_16110 [Crocinitomicaceae bacterium]|nr:hypothetical protein [Crocinitomicaceae bacterium]|tara:strand:- start:13354 stop:14913 length:1560 start_codon:yes stop_codon:yes gene_type:complete
MKYFTSISILLFLSFLSVAQETSELVTLKWGEKEEEKKDEPSKPGRHEIGNYFYDFGEDNLTLRITKFDSDSKVVGKAKLSIEHNLFKGKVYYTGYEKINDRYWITTKIKDKENFKFHFIIQELDIENLEWMDEPREFVSINFLRYGYWERLTFTQNDSSDFFMVDYHDAVVNENREVTDYIHIARLYSSEWEQLDEVRTQLSKVDARRCDNFFLLTESNKILAYQAVYGSDFFDEYDMYNAISKRSYKLLTPPLKMEFEKLMILEKKKYVEPFIAYIAEEKDNVISVKGLYNEDDDVVAEGVAFKSIDFATGKETLILNEFDPVDPVPEEPLYDPNLLRFINGTFYETESGYYFVTHKMTRKKGRYRYPGSDTKVTAFYTVMEGIYIFYYDISGKEIWKKKIPYLQFFPKGTTSSSNEFAAYLNEDNLYLIYDGYNPQDDSEKDLKLNKMLFAKKRILMCGVIEPDGEINSDRIFRDEESEYNTHFYFYDWLEDSPGFKIRYYERNKPKYGYLYFNDL